MHEMNERALAGTGAEVGAMSDTRWREMVKSMQAVGVLPADLDASAAYTLDFVKHIDVN